MENAIIIVILVVIMIFAVKGSIKHMMGQGECCGGSAPKKVKTKRLKEVKSVKSVQIDGMTCEKCKARVENALNSVDGISAKVNLHRKEAIVKIGKEIDDAAIEAIIKKQGYEVVSMKDI
ncbi:MAG: cation transporter [Lachnospiraceae bacterium]|nr:cation transporter [Lachnospiraceae bacterium]